MSGRIPMNLLSSHMYDDALWKYQFAMLDDVAKPKFIVMPKDKNIADCIDGVELDGVEDSVRLLTLEKPDVVFAVLSGSLSVGI